MNYMNEKYYNDEYNVCNMKYEDDDIEDDYENYEYDVYNMNYENKQEKYDMYPALPKRSKRNKDKVANDERDSRRNIQ